MDIADAMNTKNKQVQIRYEIESRMSIYIAPKK